MLKVIDVAIVTLFNPKNDVFDNIKSYLPYVKELLIVDNSQIPVDLKLLYEESAKIILLSSSVNLGISKSLNLAIEYSKNKGYQWLLTMDQDSSFNPLEIEKFLIAFESISKDNLAIFSPLHNQKFLKKDVTFNKSKEYVMTSGNIINIEKSLTIGGFDEKLFIDEVDHDYCLSLKVKGYTIIQNYNTYLNHSLGEKHLLNTNGKYINLYSSSRVYYMLRNYLYIRSKHKKRPYDFFAQRDKYLLKFLIKQLIHSKNRVKYIKMLFLAIKDYRNSSMGYRIAL